MRRYVSAVAAAAALTLTAGAAQAGEIFITGHDPDFHAQGQLSGQNQLNVALNFVTNGTYNDGSTKFLWVESHDPIGSGHRRGYDGLSFIGVGSGNVDWVDAAGLAGVDFSDYSAIVVASSFGGMLTTAEINALIARSADIKSFVNAGGGVAAFAECFLGDLGCGGSETVTIGTQLFGFLPVNVSAVATVAPYTLTPFGLGLGLTESDVDDCCTHNSFSATGGLQLVDFDQNGVATTLAGNVRIGGGGFEGIPEPGAWALMLLGFGGIGALLRSRRRYGLAFAG